MADGILVRLIISKELSSGLEMPDVEVKSRRDIADEGLQMGVKEVVEILAFLTTTFEVVKLSLELLRAMKKSGQRNQKAVLQSPRGGDALEIYEYEEEEVVRRKVERVFVRKV